MSNEEIENEDDPHGLFYGLTLEQRTALMLALTKAADSPPSKIRGRALKSRKDIQKSPKRT
jgi:hypothetical protein